MTRPDGAPAWDGPYFEPGSPGWDGRPRSLRSGTTCGNDAGWWGWDGATWVLLISFTPSRVEASK